MASTHSSFSLFSSPLPGGEKKTGEKKTTGSISNPPPGMITEAAKRYVSRTGKVIPKVCDFYNMPKGCRNGDTCPYQHVDADTKEVGSTGLAGESKVELKPRICVECKKTTIRPAHYQRCTECQEAMVMTGSANKTRCATEDCKNFVGASYRYCFECKLAFRSKKDAERRRIDDELSSAELKECYSCGKFKAKYIYEFVRGQKPRCVGYKYCDDCRTAYKASKDAMKKSSGDGDNAAGAGSLISGGASNVDTGEQKSMDTEAD